MNAGIKAVCRCDYDEVVEAAYVGYDEGDYDSFAFVGDLGAIQKILAILLSDYDMELTSVNIDTVEYDGMYQLIVDGYEMITIAPVLEYSDDDIRKGYVLIEGIDKWFVDDSASSRFVRILEKGGYNFEVFEIDGVDEDDKDSSVCANSLKCDGCDGCCDKSIDDEVENNNGANFTITVRPEIDKLSVEEFEHLVSRFENAFREFKDFCDWF